MKTVLTSILLFTSSLVFGQLSKQFKTNSERDTSFWTVWHHDLCNEIGLEPLYESSHQLHFRLWMGRRILEFWESEDTIHAQVVYWAEERVPGDEPPTDRYYSGKQQLKAELAKELYALVDSFGIASMPDQNEIDGWQSGLDGITYMVETVEKDAFIFKTYWTPSMQDESVKEAIVFVNFVNAIEQTQDIKMLWLELEKRVPFECYGGGILRSSCIGLTKRQRRKMKRERNNYRQHQLSK